MEATLPWEAEEYKMLREMVRQFGEKEVAPLVRYMEQNEDVPTGLWLKMANLGFLGVPFNAGFGGSGLGKMGFCTLIEELAYYHAALSLNVIAHVSLACDAVYLFGTEKQEQKYLPSGINGEKIGAFGLTEPESGSDIGAMQTMAKKVDGGWVLNGSKQFITNADMAQFVVVWAQTVSGGDNKTLAVFIIDLPAEWFTITSRAKKTGLHASHTNNFSLGNVFVPDENLLGPVNSGFKMAMQILNRSRIGIAASCLGFIRRAIDESMKFSQQRKMFGGTLYEKDLTKQKLGKMVASLLMLKSFIYQVAWIADQGRDIRNEAAAAKYWATKLAFEVVDEAVQLHGGSGYMQDYFIEQLFRDVRAYPIFEGTNEMQLFTIAKNLPVLMNRF